MQSQLEKRAQALRSMLPGTGKAPTLSSRYQAIRMPPETPPITEADLMRLKREILTELQKEDTNEISNEFVKKIIAKMKSLPESDRLEIQDIRNAQAFMFGGKKYGTHEMMHGAGQGIDFDFIDNEVVAGSGTSWTLADTPVSGSVSLYGNGQFLTPGAGSDYTISGSAIITTNSFSTGTIVANYRT